MKKEFIYIAIDKDDCLPIATSLTKDGLLKELDNYFGVDKGQAELIKTVDVNRYAEHPDILEYELTYHSQEACTGCGEYDTRINVYCMEIS